MQIFINFAFFCEKICLCQKKVVILHQQIPPRELRQRTRVELFYIMGLHYLVLESWVRSLTVLRNCVCHHARVWNRKFPVKPEMYPSLRGKWVNTQSVPPEKLYAQLCCLQYLFDAIAADNMFRVALRELLEKYPTVDIVAMGFPQDWQNEPLWTE